MNTIKKVPVVILNGFLGSGKTTLFRNLMAQAKKNDISICAIVNDMSELDVDGELLGNTDVVEDNSSILESIHSCVLSSQQGLEKMDLALHRLLSQHDPEIVVIETSGSCHPMPLIEYFKAHEDTELVGVFALVDSLMLTHDYQEGQELIPKLQYNLSNGIRDTTNLLIEQIMFCSHLFLTKSDRIPEGRLEHIASHIQAINPFASAHSVQFGRLQIESLFELEEYNYHQVAQLVDELKPILEADEQADRPYDLATRVIKDERPFHPQRLWEICHEYLDQRIYRSKGFFWLASRDRHSMLWNQAA
ncbi:MAG: GTP-binding protein, partial [Bacteroidota bacterium]